MYVLTCFPSVRLRTPRFLFGPCYLRLICVQLYSGNKTYLCGGCCYIDIQQTPQSVPGRLQHKSRINKGSSDVPSKKPGIVASHRSGESWQRSRPDLAIRSASNFFRRRRCYKVDKGCFHLPIIWRFGPPPLLYLQQRRKLWKF